MGIFDKFKRKKEEKPAAVALSKEEKTAPAKILKHDTGEAFKVLLRPRLSEKGTMMAGSGRYVFVVHSGANKSEIKKSVQKVYDVHVQKVRIIKLPPKKRRSGRVKGETSALKKAIVILRAGEKIPGIVESVG